MIKTKNDLRRVLMLEKKGYFKNKKKYVEAFLVADKDWYIYKFQKQLRLSEYYYNNKTSSFLNKLLYAYHRRKKNILGMKLGIEIWENSFAEGLRIWHAGDIVVNGYAKIGKNCQLKGNNCIGNSGKSLGAPIIGDDFSLGNGGKIIGEITIGNKVEVGAGAIVLKSCTDDNAILVGVPARNINV